MGAAVTILPITYLGSTGWFSLLSGNSIIDIGESWVKQTARNRCEILTSGGVAALTVPVHSGRNAGGEPSYAEKVATKDVRIDHSKRWAHVHWQSLVSAYRSAPFFEHYEDRFEPVFRARRHEFLVDLDLELLEIALTILRLPMPLISTEYVVASDGDLDLRGKKSLRRTESCESANAPREYIQVFSDRHPFQPGLSIIDLIFNEGPRQEVLGARR